MDTPPIPNSVPTEEPLSELNSLYKLLIADLQTAADQFIANPNDQYARRIYIRVVFTTIEGMVAAMKASALSRLTPNRYTAAEVALLSEVTFALDDKGIPRERPSFVPLTDNLKFTFRIFAREGDVVYKLPVDGDGWQCLIQAIKVRNRLTHPKNSRDLSVSDEQMEQVKVAGMWFMDCGTDVMNRLAVEAFRQKALREKDAN